MLPWKEPGVIAEVKEGGVKQKLGFEEDRREKAYIPRTGTPPPPPSAREQKRPKKQASPKKQRLMRWWPPRWRAAWRNECP
jgi:hypothetical protein